MKDSIKGCIVKIPLFIVMLFLAAFGSYAQQMQLPRFMIHFRVGATNIDPDYMNNRIALSNIAAALTSENVSFINSIHIEGYVSPEGGSAINERLSRARTDALKHYIITNYSNIQPEKITTQRMGVNWSELRRMAEADHLLPRRSEVLHIIDNVHAHIDVKANVSRKKSLMDLGVKTWNYMLVNYFPHLRTGAAIIMKPDTPGNITTTIKNTFDSLKSELPSIIDSVKTEKNVNTKSEKIIKESIVADTSIVENIVEKEIDATHITTMPLTFASERKPLFAVKTNLLFDAVSALNVEVEIPIGKRWSIAGEYIFPWWLWEEKQIAFEMLSANIEGRYWLGNRSVKKELTGWYMGLHAGGGYFDLEWKDKGYQGEFFIATGLSTGYAHTISKNSNWRMEYGLGVGYIQTKYREYVPKFGIDDEWHLIRQKDGKHTWFGPTKAKVSLVWMINNGYKNRGGAK